MGTPSAKQEVTEYRLSVHMGVCAGPAVIKKLWFGEKLAWEGSASGLSYAYIRQPELFGGEKKEGGLVALAYFMDGAGGQVIPQDLAARFGRTSEECPAFRGTTTFALVSADDPGDSTALPAEESNAGFLPTLFQRFFRPPSGKGAVISHNVPYIKTLWATVFRRPVAANLQSEFAVIDGTEANPAHIIYECITNSDWGIAMPASLIDVTSFRAAAETLFNESFGLSLHWTGQTTIEDFIVQVCEHISAFVFVDPKTGLVNLKLLRDDYTASELPLLDESNATLLEFQRRSLSETINEIEVKWLNPEFEDFDSVSYQDLANVIIQGGVVSETREYEGVRNGELAARICARDLRQASAPLASIKMTTDRRQWNINPGSVVRVTNQRYSLDEVVFRVMRVNNGTTTSPEITLELLEDIYSFSVSSTIAPPNSLFIDPRTDPDPIDYSALFSTPRYFLNQLDLTVEDGDAYTTILAASENGDTIGYELYVEGLSASGALEYQIAGSRQILTHAVTVEALDQEAESEVSFVQTAGGIGPAYEGFVLLGGEDEETQEICQFTGVDSNGAYTIERGCFDTVPRAWPAGTSAFFFEPDTAFIDQTPRSETEAVNYKLATRTSRGVLDLGATPVDSVTLTNRASKPNRPGKVRINGTGFGLVDATSAANLDITWNTRNHELEDNVVIRWNDDAVTPPAGQTTTVRVFDSTGTTELSEDAGLSGSSLTLAVSAYAGESILLVRVSSVLSGEESLQYYELPVQIGLFGWGLSWGYAWGGPPP